MPDLTVTIPVRLDTSEFERQLQLLAEAVRSAALPPGGPAARLPSISARDAMVHVASNELLSSPLGFYEIHWRSGGSVRALVGCWKGNRAIIDSDGGVMLLTTERLADVDFAVLLHTAV